MSTDLQTHETHPPKTLKALLGSPGIQNRLNEALGKKANQFASSLVSLTQQNKLLATAEPMTVLAAGMQAALLDLPISQSLGFAHVVPYKGKAQFQIGYKGLIQLALRSGQFAALNDVVVGQGQLIGYNELTGELKVDFSKPAGDGDPDGYAVYFRLTNGFEKTVFWSHEKVVDHAKRFSQAFRNNGGPWQTDFDAMARKTVIKAALSKYAPLSTDMQRAIDVDQATVDMEGNVVTYPDNGPDESAFDVEEVPGEEMGEGATESPSPKKGKAKQQELDDKGL